MLKLNGNFEKMPVPEYVYIKIDHDFRRGEADYAAKGDFVKVGQPIAFHQGEYESVLYSSVSGQIEDIITTKELGVRESEFIKIKTDGKQELWEGIKPPTVKNRRELLSAIESCGIRGIEGVTLATCLQMDENELSRLDTLVVNAAEWVDEGELEATTIKKDAEVIIDAILLVMHHLNLEKCYIGIHEGRKDAITCLQWFLKERGLDNFEIVPLFENCPPGSDRLLVFETTGELIDARMMADDMGILIANIMSFAALGHYLKEGLPIITKLITVTDTEGTGYREVVTPLGATIADIVAYCNESKVAPKQIILGGYDVAHLLKDDQVPLGRDNLAVFVFDKDGIGEPRVPCAEMCSECDVCKQNCPSHLDPGEIYQAFMENNLDRLKKTGVENCADCGRCGYVCPDKKSLGYIINAAKEMVLQA